MSYLPRFLRMGARRARRGVALLLLCTWGVLALGQAYAACCMETSGAPHSAIDASAESNRDATASGHDCCDTPEPPCPMSFDEATPPSGSAIGPSTQRQESDVLCATAPPAPQFPASVRASGPEPIPLALAPPGRIYLRLQRFLI